IKNVIQGRRRNDRAIVGHRNRQQRSDVNKGIQVEVTVLGSIFQFAGIERFEQKLGTYLNPVVLRGRLQAVDRQIQQNLNEIGAIDFQLGLFGGRVDDQLIVFDARMELEKLPKIGQDLVQIDAGLGGGLVPQKTEIAPRNLDAPADLPGDPAEPVLNDRE